MTGKDVIMMAPIVAVLAASVVVVIILAVTNFKPFIIVTGTTALLVWFAVAIDYFVNRS